MLFRANTSLVCLLAGLLLWACASPQPTLTETSPQVSQAAVVAGIFEDALTQPQALSESVLVDRLGPPVRTHAEPIPEAGAATDSLRTLVYHGVEFVCHAVTTSTDAPLVRLALTDARFTSPEGLRVGYDLEAVRRSLGPPTEQAPTWMAYVNSGPLPQGRKVSRLEWVVD